MPGRAEPSGGERFEIDPWANLNKIRACQTGDPCYGKPQGENLDQSSSGKNQLVGYSYDAAGNMLNDGLGHSLVYDAENRIKTAPGVNYTYDGDGKRVKKDSGKLYWTGTGSDPLDESDLSGNFTEEYVFFNAKRIARVDLPGGTVHYYFSDHLGSADVITNATGSTIEQESDYYPYGGERIVTAGANHYKFTGKERDSESALDYFGARYFASLQGRFTTPDPVLISREAHNPQSWNKYSYSHNRPTVLIDNNGEWPGWFHRDLIRYHFGYMGQHAVDTLIRTSNMMDSSEGQKPAQSFTHAMRDGTRRVDGSFQTPEEAGQLARQLVGDALQSAITLQAAYERSGGKGYDDDALTYFGIALHTVTDSTSPEHRGFQPWYGMSDPRAAFHWVAEEKSASSEEQAAAEARADAYQAAAILESLFVNGVRKQVSKQKGPPHPDSQNGDTVIDRN